MRTRTHSDPDFAESLDCKYTSGAVHFLYNARISWEAKKQAIIAPSTCKSEYISGSRALQHTLWIRWLLDSMHVTPRAAPSLFYMDSSTAVKIAQHTSKTQLRKHIDVRHHHLVHHVKQKIITLLHISSQHNRFDIMTKPIQRAQFQTAAAVLVQPAPTNRHDPNTNSDILV